MTSAELAEWMAFYNLEAKEQAEAQAEAKTT